MKIERIKVGKSIEAIGLWHRADLEVVVGENENPDEVFAEAKKVLDRWLPGMDSGFVRDDFIGERKVGMVEAINACTDLGVLQTFALLAKGNSEHKAAYDKKFLELSK